MSETMNNLHPNLTLSALPPRIAKLPVDHRGFPVPWFVAMIDGKYDFRVMDRAKMIRALNEKRCWICGEPRDFPLMAFVVGPMCAVTGTSGEPPSHLDCAEFAARNCPFLAKPDVERREDRIPAGYLMAETGLRRNPGVALVLITKGFQTIQYERQDGKGFDVVFKMGKPTHLEFYCRGERATREQIMESVDSGMPVLRDQAALEGPDAVTDVEMKYMAFKAMLP